MMSISIITGDCRTMLATLPAGSVQCCVTSPPYFGLRDYQVDGQIGLEQTPDAYVAELIAVFREVRRDLADSGVVWLNLGDSYARTPNTNVPQTKNPRVEFPEHTKAGSSDGLVGRGDRPGTRTTGDGVKPKNLLGIPWMVAFALRLDGWFLRSDVIWAKPNPMPESVTDRPTSAHEHVFLLSKQASYFYDAEAVAEPAMNGERFHGAYDGGGPNERTSARNGRISPDNTTATRNLRNVWIIATQPYSGAHFATMPPSLVERCVKSGTSEKGQCPTCRKPWVRMTERTETPDSTSKGSRFDSGKTGHRDGGDRTQPGERFLKSTTGWQPSCSCPEHVPVPQTVLDPFAGAGTTMLVASRLKRSAVGIELNPEYATMARNRVWDDCPMFSEMAAE